MKVAESWESDCKDGDAWERYRDCVLAKQMKCRQCETWWWDEGVRKALGEVLF